jgi:hypothetical protein
MLRTWQWQAERHGCADEASSALRPWRDVELAVQAPQMLADRRLSHGQAGGDLPDRWCRGGCLY